MTAREEQEMSISVPLSEFTTRIAEKAAWTVIEKHVATCQAARDLATLKVHQDALNEGFTRLEKRFIALVAFMVGSGVLGGAAGATIAKMLL